MSCKNSFITSEVIKDSLVSENNLTIWAYYLFISNGIISIQWKNFKKMKSVTEDTELKWNLLLWDLNATELFSYLKPFLVLIFFSVPSKN